MDSYLKQPDGQQQRDKNTFELDLSQTHLIASRKSYHLQKAKEQLEAEDAGVISANGSRILLHAREPSQKRLSSRARLSRALLSQDVEQVLETNQDLPQTIRLQLRWNEQDQESNYMNELCEIASPNKDNELLLQVATEQTPGRYGRDTNPLEGNENDIEPESVQNETAQLVAPKMYVSSEDRKVADQVPVQEEMLAQLASSRKQIQNYLASNSRDQSPTGMLVPEFRPLQQKQFQVDQAKSDSPQNVNVSSNRSSIPNQKFISDKINNVQANEVGQIMLQINRWQFSDGNKMPVRKHMLSPDNKSRQASGKAKKSNQKFSKTASINIGIKDQFAAVLTSSMTKQPFAVSPRGMRNVIRKQAQTAAAATADPHTGPPMFRAVLANTHSPFIALQRSHQRVKALQQKQMMIDQLNQTVRTQVGSAQLRNRPKRRLASANVNSKAPLHRYRNERKKKEEQVSLQMTHAASEFRDTTLMFSQPQRVTTESDIQCASQQDSNNGKRDNNKRRTTCGDSTVILLSNTPELGKTDSKTSQRTTLLMNKEARAKQSRGSIKFKGPNRKTAQFEDVNSPSQLNVGKEPYSTSVVDLNRMTEKQLPKRSTSQMEDIVNMSVNLNRDANGTKSSQKPIRQVSKKALALQRELSVNRSSLALRRQRLYSPQAIQRPLMLSLDGDTTSAKQPVNSGQFVFEQQKISLSKPASSQGSPEKEQIKVPQPQPDDNVNIVEQASLVQDKKPCAPSEDKQDCQQKEEQVSLPQPAQLQLLDPSSERQNSFTVNKNVPDMHQLMTSMQSSDSYQIDPSKIPATKSMERALTIEEVAPSRSVNKNQSLNDLRSSKARRALLKSASTTGRRMYSRPMDAEKVFYKIEGDHTNSAERVIVRVKQTGTSAGYFAGNKSDAVVSQPNTRKNLQMQIGSLSSQSDCTFRDMHFVNSLEQTMRVNGQEIGPWTAENQTSDADILSSQNVGQAVVNDVGDTLVDVAIVKKGNNGIIGMYDGKLPIGMLSISQREPLNKLYKRQKEQTRRFRTQQTKTQRQKQVEKHYQLRHCLNLQSDMQRKVDHQQRLVIAHHKQQIEQQLKLKEHQLAVNAKVRDYSNTAATSQGSFVLKSPTVRPTVPLKEISEEKGSILAVLPGQLNSKCESSIALQDATKSKTDQYYQSMDTINSRDPLGESQNILRRLEILVIKPPGVELRKVCNRSNEDIFVQDAQQSPRIANQLMNTMANRQSQPLIRMRSLRGIVQIQDKPVVDISSDGLILSSVGKDANIISYTRPSCHQETVNLRKAAHARQTTYRTVNQHSRDRQVYFQAKSTGNVGNNFALEDRQSLPMPCNNVKNTSPEQQQYDLAWNRDIEVVEQGLTTKGKNRYTNSRRSINNLPYRKVDNSRNDRVKICLETRISTNGPLQHQTARTGGGLSRKSIAGRVQRRASGNTFSGHCVTTPKQSSPYQPELVDTIKLCPNSSGSQFSSAVQSRSKVRQLQAMTVNTGPFELKVLGTNSGSMIEQQQDLVENSPNVASLQKMEKRDSLISPGIDNFLDSKYQDRNRQSANSSAHESSQALLANQRSTQLNHASRDTSALNIHPTQTQNNQQTSSRVAYQQQLQQQPQPKMYSNMNPSPPQNTNKAIDALLTQPRQSYNINFTSDIVSMASQNQLNNKKSPCSKKTSLNDCGSLNLNQIGGGLQARSSRSKPGMLSATAAVHQSNTKARQVAASQVELQPLITPLSVLHVSVKRANRTKDPHLFSPAARANQLRRKN